MKIWFESLCIVNDLKPRLRLTFDLTFNSGHSALQLYFGAISFRSMIHSILPLEDELMLL